MLQPILWIFQSILRIWLNVSRFQLLQSAAFVLQQSSFAMVSSMQLPASRQRQHLRWLRTCAFLTSLYAFYTFSGGWVMKLVFLLGSTQFPESFTDNYQGKNLTVPNSVTQGEDRAFAEFHVVSSLKIPTSATHIGDSAFHGCERLSGLAVSDSGLLQRTPNIAPTPSRRRGFFGYRHIAPQPPARRRGVEDNRRRR